ncbi:translation initiation factor eIF 4e-like domain-containing protein [Pilobolus umbonatus]|nr:translation initiation factor eIF 4e-like domain-containing protein [Pilobolus umbonatus]
MSDSQKVDFSSKHSLQNTWTLWFDNPRHKSNMKSWAENLKEIISINTVEEFWSTLNNIAKVSHLDLNSNYHFFKKGIFPQWEDEANVKGGKISIMLPKNKSDLINEYWLNILMAIIGEQLGNENEVCGVVVSVRKSNYRLSLWINTSEEEDVNRIRYIYIYIYMCVCVVNNSDKSSMFLRIFYLHSQHMIFLLR